MKNGGVVEFRCRVGHRYSEESMVDAQRDAVEHAKWAALRALEEKADLHRRLAARTRARSHSHSRFVESARAAEEQVRMLRSILLDTESRASTTPDSDQPSSAKMSEP